MDIRRSRAALQGLLLLLLCGVVRCQFGMPGMGGAPAPEPVLAELPYIKCAVCKAASRGIVEAVAQFREKATAHKIHEDEIGDLLQRVCDPKMEGKWITNYDLKTAARRLVLDYQTRRGKCGRECATIAKSCARWIDDEVDVEEMVVALWKGTTAEELEKKACNAWSSRCAKADPLLTGERTDEEFVEKSDEDLQMDTFMEEMQRMQAATGQKFSMMGGDEMANMADAMEMGGMGGDYGGDFGEF